MTETIRAFIALEIPDAIKAEISRTRTTLQAQVPRARWVNLERQHLTLKFLGEVPKPTLDALVADLAPALMGLGCVQVGLGGAGFFPSPKRPRVAWVGGVVDGIDPLVEAVERTALARGFPAERRRWSPHLTQARLNRPWPPEAVERFLAWGQGLLLEPYMADEAVLFSSRLEPGGAVYTALERMRLE